MRVPVFLVFVAASASSALAASNAAAHLGVPEIFDSPRIYPFTDEFNGNSDIYPWTSDYR